LTVDSWQLTNNQQQIHLGAIVQNLQNLLKKFMPGKSAGLGIELAPDRINIVQLSQKKPGYKLENFFSVEVEEGLIEEGIIADPPEIAMLIQMALADNNIKAKQVATAIPAKEGVIRVVPVPAELNDEELREMVNQEAGLYLPFPREEADVDYKKMGIFEDEDGIEKFQVLLVATRKEVTDTYISTFEQAGLKIDILDLTIFALLRTIQNELEQLPPEEPVAIADIEFDSTEIAILMEGIPQFSRTIPIGAYQIQTALSQAMNLPPSRNTEMLQEMSVPANPTEITGEGTMGESNPGVEAIVKVLSELTDELRRSIDFFINQSEGPDVSQLFLAGPGATIGQIDDFFNHRLGLPVTIIDPVANMAIEDEEQKLSQVIRPGLGVVLGLGMREV
jgi:type IV pilus assembly protein PilM